MIERFLLDRIDTESTGSPVRRQDDLILLPRPDETEPLLPFLERAISRTEIALNAAVFQPVPIFRRCNGLHRASLYQGDWRAGVGQFQTSLTANTIACRR